MKITALEIKQHEFEKSFRGYNIEEVDIFLNNIANEWERTSNEAKMLRMQLEIAEKEAAKLREVEMSLIKTLQTAETTSSKITEHAKMEADAKIEEAKLEALRLIEEAESKKKAAASEADQIIKNAKSEAENLISEAKNTVSENQKALLSKEENLKSEIENLENHRLSIVKQLRQLTDLTLEKIGGIDSDLVSTPAVTKFVAAEPEPVSEEVKEVAPTTEIEKVIDEEVKGIASSANTLVLEEEKEEVEEEIKEDDLTIIEGIGPKISELLKVNGISTYRDLATHPAYKIKEILESAGSNYAMHDPSSWAEQAILASSEKWDELASLKEHLVGGKEPETAPEAPKAQKEEVVEEEPVESSEQVTEEMLSRVNKVKAALKKAMMEKEAGTAPKVKTINDAAAENKEGGSFFDNL